MFNNAIPLQHHTLCLLCPKTPQIWVGFALDWKKFSAGTLHIPYTKPMGLKEKHIHTEINHSV